MLKKSLQGAITVVQLKEGRDTMPLYVSKFERLEGADRDSLALAALEACRAARTMPGVANSPP